MESVGHDVDHLHTLLAREKGEIPRRAALVGDIIYELRDAPPGTNECTLLSKICEFVKQSRGEPIYSRDVEKLLNHCLQTNDEQAWSALCDDAMCGLLSPQGVEEYFHERPGDAACFVWRFQSATSAMQSACILKVFSVCFPTFSEDAVHQFVASLRRGQGAALLSAYALHARSLPLRARAMALESLGMVLDDEETFIALAKDALESLLTNPVAEDVLTILMASPIAPRLAEARQNREELRSMFMTMAQKAPIPRRAPYLLALSHVLHRGDTDIKPFLLETLQKSTDIPTVFRAGVKVVRVIEPAHDVSGLLSAFIADLENKNLP